jgi:hypothetical protein
MSVKPVENFNVEPLLIEIENVIKKGLNNVHSDFMDRYNLLEETHKQIMNLPSVRHELNKSSCNLENDSDSDSEFDKYVIKPNINLYEPLVIRLEKLEKKYDNMIPILDKLLNKINDIDKDIKDLKKSDKKISDNILLENVKKSSVIKTSENENIEIHVEEEVLEHQCNINQPLINLNAEIEDNINSKKVLVEVDKLEDNKKVHQNDMEQEKDEVEEVEEQEVDEQEEEVDEEDEEEEAEEEAEEEVDEEKEEEVDEEDEEEVAEEEVDEEKEEEQEEEVDEQEEEEEVQEEEEQENASIETETRPEQKDEVEEPENNEKLESNECEDEDAELFEIEIDDKTYCTNDDQNGFIWEMNDEGEQGDKVGYLKDGEAFFYEDEK